VGSAACDKERDSQDWSKQEASQSPHLETPFPFLSNTN
jgi:hypothetical protein